MSKDIEARLAKLEEFVEMLKKERSAEQLQKRFKDSGAVLLLEEEFEEYPAGFYCKRCLVPVTPIPAPKGIAVDNIQCPKCKSKSRIFEKDHDWLEKIHRNAGL